MHTKKKLDLVRKIMFFIDKETSYDWYYYLLTSYPQIQVFIENPHIPDRLTYLQRAQIGRLSQLTLDSSSTFQEYNAGNMALVQKLNVVNNPACYNQLGKISELENLKTIRFYNVLNVIHDLFKSNYFQKLHIEQLSIFWKGEINPAYIKDLEHMFNLNKLKTLELHFCLEKTRLLSLESDLQSVLSQTYNLKQLVLTSKHINFTRLVNTLKSNTLTSLHLRCIPPLRSTVSIHQEFPMKEILGSQRESIIRVNFRLDGSHDMCHEGLE